jgi:hypothetical protein
LIGLGPAEVVGTFTTGNEPSLLGDSAIWWTEAGSSSSDFERYLGISKEMTEMVAKVSTLKLIVVKLMYSTVSYIPE